jgi:oligosaccharide repeat unit polymerase
VLAEGLRRPAESIANVELFPPEEAELWSDRAFAFTVLFTIVSMSGTMYLLVFSLQKYSLEFSPVALVSLGHLWSVARYQNGELEPWSVRFLIMWVYPAVLLAGVNFALAHRSIRKYVSFAPLIPAALIGSLFAIRAGLLFAVVCWLSGFFAVRHYGTKGHYALFQKKLVMSMVTLGLCGFCFFLGIDALRHFQGGGSDMEVTIDAPRLSKYFFGAVPAFSTWFHYNHPAQTSWGAFTFSGLFDLLGIKQRQIGVYQDYLILAGGEDINIYTMLRGLIEDFSIAGACLFGALLGLLGGLASKWKCTSGVLTLSAFYAMLLFSPLISLFAYNGLILAWTVGALVFRFRPRRRTLQARSVLA